MNFNKHSTLDGSHAILSASKYHWVNYSEERLIDYYNQFSAVVRGTKLHEFAKTAIELGRRMPKNNDSVNQFINDAIGYRMTPEQILRYSDNCFGTTDAISFSKKTLRIHDLKTGTTTASMRQLDVYVALFCLEYKYKPDTISIEERIYQNNEVIVRTPPPDDITFVMDKIVSFDKIIEALKLGG